jgi:integral membrane protein
MAALRGAANRGFDLVTLRVAAEPQRRPISTLPPMLDTASCHAQMRNSIQALRLMTVTEGISFLLLLGIAMPLKYIWAMPIAVRIAGLVHGVLFLLLCALLVYVSLAAKWRLSRSALVLAAALVPFGPWLIDRRMKEYEAEAARLDLTAPPNDALER